MGVVPPPLPPPIPTRTKEEVMLRSPPCGIAHYPKSDQEYEHLSSSDDGAHVKAEESELEEVHHEDLEEMLNLYVSICQFPLLGLSDCHVVQVSYAAVDSPCTATHLYSAASPTVYFAIAPTTHRPCSQPLPILFHYCPILVQFLFDANPPLSQQRTSHYPIFLCTYIPHSTPPYCRHCL